MEQPKAPLGRLARIGAGSPLYVTAVYSVGDALALVLTALGTRTGIRALSLIGLLIWLIGFGIAYAIVTWYRDDDVLAAAFLLGVSATVASAAIGLIAAAIGEGTLASMGGAAFAFGGSILGFAIQGAMAVAVCALLIAVGRAVRPGIAKPVPPARRH